MANDQEDLGNDELSDGLDELCEECMEEYVIEGEYTSSSTHISIVEQRVSPVPIVVKKPKTVRSSSENISTVIPSFQSSSSLNSTFSPASWPSLISKTDTYLQSSGGIEGITYTEYDVSSSEPEQVKVLYKAETPKRRTDTKVSKRKQSKVEEPTEKQKRSKCTKIPFLHDILEDELSRTPQTKVHFVERLKISVDRHKILTESNLTPTMKLTIPETDFAGDFSLNVEDIREGVGIFIESYSSFKDGEYNCGTQFFSKNTTDFLLVEEKRTEFQYSDTERKEKSMHVFIGSDNYIAYRSTTVNDEEKEYRGCIAVDWHNDFVLDGGIFGIMRHLIAVQFSGCFQCFAVTLSGRVCRQVFCVDEKKFMQINEKVLEVILLRKSTYDYYTKKKIEVTETYFLPTGGLVYHTWKYSPYIVHIDPVLLGHDKKLNPCMELTWKSDCILRSMFEFEKEYSQCLLQTYLDNYPEVLELLNDYIISLFHEKPRCVVKFTCNFFEHA